MKVSKAKNSLRGMYGFVVSDIKNVTIGEKSPEALEKLITIDEFTTEVNIADMHYISDYVDLTNISAVSVCFDMYTNSYSFADKSCYAVQKNGDFVYIQEKTFKLLLQLFNVDMEQFYPNSNIDWSTLKYLN